MIKIRYLFLLCTILLLKAILIVWLVLHSGIGLGPDEAQYWTWSQHLDWGYYSKPPGIAWQIWLGCQLFGNTELGVRFGSIVLGTILPLAVYGLAAACRSRPAVCFWAAIAMALAPMGMLNSFLAITDGGMVLFWTMALLATAKGIEKNDSPDFLWVGFWIFCGALFKWPIYQFWIVIFIFCFPYRSWISWNLVKGIGISLLGLIPSLIWNASHNWVTFRHVWATMIGRNGKDLHNHAVQLGNPLEFIGAQAALFSPIFFVLLLFAFYALIRQRLYLSKSLFFCGTVTLLFMGVYTLLSFVMKMQGNWCDFAFPSAAVLMSWYAIERVRHGRDMLIAGAVLAVVMSLLAFSIPTIQSEGFFKRIPLPYKMNPFRHNVGWNALGKVLQEAGYRPDQDVLVGDKYQTTSILSFYGEGQKIAHFLNLQGTRLNQFSFWPGIPENKKAFFVVVENSPHLEKNLTNIVEKYSRQLQEYFREVHYLGLKPLFHSYGEMVKGAFIFECLDYNGKEPQNPESY